MNILKNSFQIYSFINSENFAEGNAERSDYSLVKSSGAVVSSFPSNERLDVALRPVDLETSQLQSSGFDLFGLTTMVNNQVVE